MELQKAPPAPPCLTKGLLTAIPVSQHIIYGYQEKNDNINGKSMCVCVCMHACTHTHTQLLTEKASEQDQVTTGMLELSDWEFKTATINMPEALMGKVDTIQGELGDVNREMEVQKKH